MKAKEYYQRYSRQVGEGPDLGHKADVLLDTVIKPLMGEIATLADLRNVTSGGGLTAIIKELEKKWQAIYRMIGGDWLDPEAFKKVLTAEIPDTVMFWPK